MPSPRRDFYLLPLLAAAVVSACSGGSAVEDPGDAASVESGPGDAGSNPDSSKFPDRRIDPIDLGYEWTYSVTILGIYPACEAGVHSAKVIGATSYGGKAGFRVQSLCANAGVSAYAVDGDKVEVRVLETGAWELALGAPVAEGQNWSNSYGSFVWNALPDQVVGGKTYNECWQAKDKNGVSYTNYCRGIGPVRWYVVDSLGNGYDAVRQSVSF